MNGGAERARVSRRVTVVGAVVNLVLSVLKILFGYFGHSQALIADGVHSLSDLLSDGVVYYASTHSHEEPDDEHPYGHGRFETLATLALGALLLLVAGGLAYDAAERLFRPETLLEPSPIVLWIAGLSILSKEWLYHYTMRAARRVRSDMLRANAWHHRSDSVSSVVVLVGVAGTLAGLPYLDAIAAVVVAVMVAHIGWSLGRDAIRELVDAGLEAERVAAIQETIRSVAGVREIHMLRTRRIGGNAMADVHVQVEPRISVSEGHLISETVRAQLIREIDELTDVTVHIDPEDDEIRPPSIGLPMRAEITRRFQAVWDGLGLDLPPPRLLLHYLAGRVHIDVHLPLSALDSKESAPAIATRLRDALAAEREVGEVRVFWD